MPGGGAPEDPGQGGGEKHRSFIHLEKKELQEIETGTCPRTCLKRTLDLFLKEDKGFGSGTSPWTFFIGEV